MLDKYAIMLIGLTIIDGVQTFMGVFYLGIASELNPLVTSIWVLFMMKLILILVIAFVSRYRYMENYWFIMMMLIMIYMYTVLDNFKELIPHFLS